MKWFSFSRWIGIHQSLASVMIILAGFVVVSPAFPNDDHDPHPGQPKETVVESANIESPKELASVMDFVHHALEGTDPQAGWFRKFLQNFNLSRHVKNAIRVRNLNENHDHAQNMVFLFFASHTGETLSGPVYIAWAIINGVPIQVAAPTASFLLSLAVPGIDWGCIVLQGLYLGSEDFREVVTWGRVYTIKGLKGASDGLGVTDAINALITHEPADSYIRKQMELLAESMMFRTEEGDEHRFTLLDTDGQPICTLQLETQDDTVVLENVTFNQAKLSYVGARGWGRVLGWWENSGWERFNFWGVNRSKTRARLKESLTPFGWNIRDAVLVAYDHLSRGKADSTTAPYFVRSLEFWHTALNSFVAMRVEDHEDDHDDHHPGEDHHDHEVEFETVPIAAPTHLEKNQIRLNYYKPAIRRHAERHWNFRNLEVYLGVKADEKWGQLCKMLLNPVSTVASGLGLVHRGMISVQDGIAWVYHNPESVRYHLKRAGLFVPLAGLKVFNIASQMVQSILGATKSLVGTITKPALWCRDWLLELGEWKQPERQIAKTDQPQTPPKPPWEP